MGMIVREAQGEDFDNIFQLLKRLNSTSLGKEEWRKIARPYFEAAHNHYGYVLEGEGKEIQGFLGTVFSERFIEGEKVRFCNIHSWIVSPEAKNGGISLLMKVLRLKEHVITNFTASEIPYQIFKGLSFQEIAYKNFKLMPFQSFSNIEKVRIEIITDANAHKLLGPEELMLYKDHRQFENVQFIWIGHKRDTAFVISKRKAYLPAPFKKLGLIRSLLNGTLFLSQIHYVNNSPLFFKVFHNTIHGIRICKKLKVLGLLVSDHFIPADVKLKKDHYPRKRPYMYKNSIIEERNIDTLYSEFFVLDF